MQAIASKDSSDTKPDCSCMGSLKVRCQDKKGGEWPQSGLQDCRLVASTSVLLPCLPGLLLVMEKLYLSFCAEGTSRKRKATNSMAMEKLGHEIKYSSRPCCPRSVCLFTTSVSIKAEAALQNSVNE